MKNIKVISNNDGYEGLYVDNELVAEGNPLNEGTERIIYFLQLSKTYETPLENFVFSEMDCDEFPMNLKGETK